MEEKKNKNVIDLREVARKLWNCRWLFFKVWLVTFVVASALILCVPRTYTSSVSLAPESDVASSGGALGSLASSFGVDLGEMGANGDAIQPLLYPQLFESPEFVTSLFDIEVTNAEGDIHTTYYEYLSKYQKKTLYKIPFTWLVRKIKNIIPKEPVKGSNNNGEVDPFNLTEAQNHIASIVKRNITCNVDKQFWVITIMVTDQDRRICATMADSVRYRLQEFITEYRTKKARVDADYYTRLTAEAKDNYEKSLQKYSAFCDANRNSILQSYISHRDELENEMQLNYNTYTAMRTQQQSALAKVQERTPAFTILKSASMPIRASGPKRMLFVLGMLIFASFGTMLYVMRDSILSSF